MTHEAQEQDVTPPVEPGHVMSREKFERMLEEQQQ